MLYGLWAVACCILPDAVTHETAAEGPGIPAEGPGGGPPQNAGGAGGGAARTVRATAAAVGPGGGAPEP